MNTHDGERLDAVIDDAARQLVAAEMPPRIVPAVMAAIEGRVSGRLGQRLRVVLVPASIALTVALVSLVWPRSEGDVPSAGAPVVETPAPDASVSAVIERRTLNGDLLDGWIRPRPVEIAPVTVAPVTIHAVQVAPVEVGRVEVAIVEIVGAAP